MIRPPPPPCTVCGRSHDAVVHTSPEAAALEWARTVCQRARFESSSDVAGYVLAESTLERFDGMARFWSSHVRLLLRRAS